MSTSSHSPYSTLLATVLASSVLDVRRGIRSQAEEDIDSIAELAVAFLSSPVSPVAVFDFEVALNALVRELGRKVLEFACNRCEPEACAPSATAPQADMIRAFSPAASDTSHVGLSRMCQ